MTGQRSLERKTIRPPGDRAVRQTGVAATTLKKRCSRQKMFAMRGDHRAESWGASARFLASHSVMSSGPEITTRFTLRGFPVRIGANRGLLPALDRQLSRNAQ